MAKIEIFYDNANTVNMAKAIKKQFNPVEENSELHAPSNFNCHTRKHEVILKLVMDQPFNVVQVAAKESKTTGIGSLITIERSSFPFERLPPEVRNMIYALVLKHKEWKIISIYRHGQSGALRQFKKSDSAVPRLGAMLHVSKLFHLEASTWLYAAREFEFHDPTTCHEFLRKIGKTNRGQLRSIIINSPGQTIHSVSCDIFRLLQDAKHLKRLVFHAKTFKCARKGLGNQGLTNVMVMLGMILHQKDRDDPKELREEQNMHEVMSILQFHYPYHCSDAKFGLNERDESEVRLHKRLWRGLDNLRHTPPRSRDIKMVDDKDVDVRA